MIDLYIDKIDDDSGDDTVVMMIATMTAYCFPRDVPCSDRVLTCSEHRTVGAVGSKSALTWRYCHARTQSTPTVRYR